MCATMTPDGARVWRQALRSHSFLGENTRSPSASARSAKSRAYAGVRCWTPASSTRQPSPFASQSVALSGAHVTPRGPALPW